jgi:hypothetical protein
LLRQTSCDFLRANPRAGIFFPNVWLACCPVVSTTSGEGRIKHSATVLNIFFVFFLLGPSWFLHWPSHVSPSRR